MSISIKLYRVSSAEKIEDLKTLEKEMDDAKENKVDLYKMSEDLAIIFLNKATPWTDTNEIPYKMLFGRRVSITVGSHEIGGFLPTSEIAAITNWIKQTNINTLDGFLKMYANLSKESLNELEEIGSPSKEELFNFYVKPLTEFYFAALKENNSIVISGE